MIFHLLIANLLYCGFMPPSLILARRWRPSCNEWVVACTHVKQDDPRAPNINLDCHLLAKNLGSHIEQSSTYIRCIFLTLVEELSQTKVNDLDGSTLPVYQHNVL